MPGEHFSGGQMPHKPIQRLDNELYANVERNIVYGCTDVAIRNPQTGEIFLGDRQTEPQIGPWFVGGRNIYANGFDENAALQVKQDLGLDLPKWRFEYVTSYSTDFPVASPQNPDHGRHTQNAVMLVDLSPQEVEELNRKVTSGEIRDEYSNGGWHDPSEIVDRKSDYAYVLKQFVRDLRERELLHDAIRKEAEEEDKAREQGKWSTERDQETKDRIAGLQLFYGLTGSQAAELEQVAHKNAAYSIEWARVVAAEKGDKTATERVRDLIDNHFLGDVQITQKLQEMGIQAPNFRSDNGPALRSILGGSLLAIKYNQESDGEVFDRSEALEDLAKRQ